MRTSSVLLGVLLLLIVALVRAQLDVDVQLLQHKLRQRENECTDLCVTRYKKVEKCMDVCSSIVTDNSNIEEEIQKMVKAEEAAATLSDSMSPEEEQEQAEASLYELYYKAMRELLTSGSYSQGFQLVEPAIELSDVEGQIPGWDGMPSQILSKQVVDDFDNLEILGQELILTSKPGPLRETNGIRWIDEYKQFLAGVQGVQSLHIPQPSEVLSAQKTIDFQYALNNCTEKYMMASYFIMMRYDLDAYSNTFCPEVKRAENEMFTQIGREQYSAGNNPVYGAAVALGVAQGMYYNKNAFKKFQSFRTLEAECLGALNEGRPIQGIVKSMSFNYNYHTYKSTSETLVWKTKKRRLFGSKTTTHTKTTITNFDAKKVGGVEISFADYRAVPLFPGEWFTKSAMRDFRHQAREGAPIDRFFGATGTLTLLPKQLYIGVSPTISFWVSSDMKDVFNYDYTKVTKGGFGVFGIGLSSKSRTQVKIVEGVTQNGQTKISLISTTCTPQLFAVDNLYTY